MFVFGIFVFFLVLGGGGLFFGGGVFFFFFRFSFLVVFLFVCLFVSCSFKRGKEGSIKSVYQNQRSGFTCRLCSILVDPLQACCPRLRLTGSQCETVSLLAQ